MSTTEEDARLVAQEVAVLRLANDRIAQLRADLLEQAPPETAATYLREMALQALTWTVRDAGLEWAVSAYLQHQIYLERRRGQR